MAKTSVTQGLSEDSLDLWKEWKKNPSVHRIKDQGVLGLQFYANVINYLLLLGKGWVQDNLFAMKRRGRTTKKASSQRPRHTESAQDGSWTRATKIPHHLPHKAKRTTVYSLEKGKTMNREPVSGLVSQRRLETEWEF